MNEDALIKAMMARGDKIMYDVIPELCELLKIPAVADRVTIQGKFINYCIENDIVDLHCHRYNVAKCHKLKAIL